jgi:hypothetical protein
MRKSLIVLVAAMVVGMTIPAFAELQNVEVGGSLRIRGNWYSESNLSFDHDLGPDALFFEQRTKINVSASFTQDVNAFIELDSYDVFGDGFRGLDDSLSVYSDRRGFSSGANGLSGVDNGSNGTSVSFYQGYIEVKDAWGTPLSFRIGRQEIQFGSEFLVGNNDTSSFFRGLSFDGLTTNSQFGNFKLQSFFTELVTNNNPFRFESSGDVWFHGFYGSYVGIEGMTIDGYVMHYYQALTDPLAGIGLVEATDFYTAGLRFAGSKSQFDWDVEGAYQFGDSGLPSPNDSINAYALTAKGGYTFDVNMQPRVFLNGAYFSADEDDPAFNRMFSDHEYSEFLDATDLTNFWMIGGGASAQVTESINLSGVANYFESVEDYGTDENSLGIEVALYAKYDYSEDLYFQAGYAHFFAGDAMESGAFVTSGGVGLIGGFGQSDDMDYVFVETGLKF